MKHFILLAVFATGCVPTIHFVDRPTVMELEAAGDWPNFEKELEKSSLLSGPYPLPPKDVKQQKNEYKNNIDGEYTVRGK